MAGRVENEARADYTKALSGKPLGLPHLEYRGHYLSDGACLAVYIHRRLDDTE